jgi:hypothetical protein
MTNRAGLGSQGPRSRRRSAYPWLSSNIPVFKPSLDSRAVIEVSRRRGNDRDDLVGRSARSVAFDGTRAHRVSGVDLPQRRFLFSHAASNTRIGGRYLAFSCSRCSAPSPDRLSVTGGGDLIHILTR